MGTARGLVTRLSTWRPRRRSAVAFVLSGGGPLGALQVGQLQALAEKGIIPDLILGVSVGGVNGVFTASDPTPAGAKRLEEVWLRMKREHLFPKGKIVSAWNAVKRGSHVFSNAGLRKLLDSELVEKTFEDLQVPCQVVATNLETGAETWFSSGPITDPLLASSAMPGIFPPVEIDGVAYIDGGVANNIPFSRAVELGATKIYVLNVHSWFQPRPLTRPHDFMMHGYLLARAQRYRHDLERLSPRAQIIEFPPVDVGHVPFTNLSQTERLIQAGRTAALEFLGPAPAATEPEMTEPPEIAPQQA